MVPRGGMQLVRKFKALQREGRKRRRPSNLAQSKTPLVRGWPLRSLKSHQFPNESWSKICRGLGISEQSYYRWRRLYGGLKVDQARRLKDLERENQRLKKAVSELTLDKLILKEALEGKY
jgi:putative transposase